MSFVQSALEKMAVWMHHVSSGGSPLGVLHLAQGAKDDLAKAAAEFVGADPADNSASDLNAAEAAKNQERASAMAAGMPQHDHS